MKIAFLGTPDFALPSLRAVQELGNEITVFTQPDRKKGRGEKHTMPPVKEVALSLGLPVLQFEQIRCTEGVNALRKLEPDLMITVAFGQILTKEILDIPRYGCINVHASLLPKYRGAAPIQHAILNGEKTTGVTTMMTDVGLDTGDILLVHETEIDDSETAGELFDRLAIIGAETLVDTIECLKNGTLKCISQDESKATKCRMIKKEHGKIDFRRSAWQIHNQVRAMNPWPSAYALWNDAVVKIHKTEVRNDMISDRCPGTCIIASPKQGLFVATGDGVLEIQMLQMPGSRAMSAKEMLNSKKLLDEVLV